MQYLGGKSRIAKPIAALMLEERGDRQTYIEPFLGAGSVALLMAPHFETVLATDSMPDLILLWRAVQDGWVPPETLSEDEYRALRNAEPSALRGFAGFPCSFGGKWFGGYARDPKGGRNFAASASRSMVKRGSIMAHAKIAQEDYRNLDRYVTEDAVVYLDPPYAGTVAYKGTDPFDSEEFWDTARRWSGRGANVYVSEYQGPEDATVVWEGRPQTSITRNHGAGSTVHEKLYRLNH